MSLLRAPAVRCMISLFAVIALVVLEESAGKSKKPPHIIFLVIDDLGSHDLGMHGSKIRTRNIDNLVAEEGLYLDNYYTFSRCTQTRIALMSGKYPYLSGIYKTISRLQDLGMNLKDETLPEMLKNNAAYSTHGVGKWHLGHAMYEQTPTYRGFESFFGFYGSGTLDAFAHTDRGDYSMRWDRREFCGPGCSSYADERGNYSTHIFTREANRVIENHASSKKMADTPLFLYVGYQALHKPYQVPKEYEKLYSGLAGWSERRQQYAGMLTAADESVGLIVKKLKDTGLWEDSVIIFTTDNGAAGRGEKTHDGRLSAEYGDPSGPGSNYPLRGGKSEVWEGGIHGDGFLAGPALKDLGIRTPSKRKAFFHALDWFPTLAAFAGVPKQSYEASFSDVDGVDQYEMLQGGKAARTEFHCGYAYTKDDPKDVNRYSAYISNNNKLIWDNVKKNLAASEMYDITKKPIEGDAIAGDDTASALRFEMEKVERRFVSDRSGGQCEFSVGVTPWNKPGAHPFCDEAGFRGPRALKSSQSL